MPLSRRYTPEHPPGESCMFGFDFSPLIPPGVGLTQGTMFIQYNVADAESTADQAEADWTGWDAVTVRGRALYAMLTGGVLGSDYQFHWVAYDTQGNIWPRTGLILCGYTS
jgi:hypothetical protein